MKFLLKPTEEVTMRAFLDRRHWGAKIGATHLHRKGTGGQGQPRATGAGRAWSDRATGGRGLGCPLLDSRGGDTGEASWLDSEIIQVW